MPGLTVFAVVPVKPLGAGKSRLAAALSASARAALNRRLLDHALGIAARVPGPERTVVVSRDADVLDRARARGMRALAEAAGDPGLNRALDAGRAEAVRLGAGAVMVLPVDLPLLSAEDVEALIGRADGRERVVVIAPDEAAAGTNALLLAPPDAIGFRFGAASLAAHEAAARRAGLAVEIIRRDGLAFDVDTPADLARLRQMDAEATGGASRDHWVKH